MNKYPTCLKQEFYIQQIQKMQTKRKGEEKWHTMSGGVGDEERRKGRRKGGQGGARRAWTVAKRRQCRWTEVAKGGQGEKTSKKAVGGRFIKPSPNSSSKLPWLCPRTHTHVHRHIGALGFALRCKREKVGKKIRKKEKMKGRKERKGSS